MLVHPNVRQNLGNMRPNDERPGLKRTAEVILALLWKLYGKRGFMKTFYSYLFTAFVSVVALNSSAQDQQPDQRDAPNKIVLSPNPVPGNQFFIDHDSCSYDRFDRIIIYNSNGFVMLNKQLELQKGTTREQVSIAGYQPGNYIVRIVDIKDPLFSFSSQLVVH